MAEKLTISEKCFRLSKKLLALGTATNGRRAAQELFAQLTDAATELGSGIVSVNYLPARSMRTQQIIEAVKKAQKVIYILNLSLREGMFLTKPTTEALNLAVDVANELNGLVQAYTGYAVQAVSSPAAGGRSKRRKRPGRPRRFQRALYGVSLYCPAHMAEITAF